MFPRRRFERAPAGGVRVRLGRRERELLRRVAAELRVVIEQEATSEGERLFPAAYVDDERSEAEFAELVRDELRVGKLAALDELTSTLGEQSLTAKQADAWLRALNDARLVLGTRLDVREDTFASGLDRRDPRAPELAVYGYLSWLQEQLIDVVSRAELEGRD